MTCPTSADRPVRGTQPTGIPAGELAPDGTVNLSEQVIRSGAVGGADEIPDGAAALVVTSPPYPMIALWDRHFGARDQSVRRALLRGDGADAFERMHRALDPVWKAMHRILLPGGILCINVGDATRTIGGTFALYPNHARILQACLELGFQDLPNILWRKPTNAPTKFMGSGMLPPGAYVTLEHEHLLVFRKGGRREFPDPAGRSARRRSAYFWEERNRWFSDLWEIRGTEQELRRGSGRARSAAFPLEIPFRLILMFSCAGDLVVDPFLGTGTTMLAAAASGRNCIGYELDPRLAAGAARRLAGARDQLNRRLELRLEEHQVFVRARGSAAFRHRNDRLGMPVMTRQEREMMIPSVERISNPLPLHFTVQYNQHPAPGHRTPR